MGNKASALPYDVGDKVCALGSSGWWLHEGKRKRDGEPVSVFRFQKKDASPRQKEMAENFFKRVKTLRHPHVLGYMDGLDSESETFVVTESVVTLDSWLDTERLKEGKDKMRLAVAWGFHCILQALGFVNVDCKLLHGNVSTESILVTKGGDWKLGGLFIVGDVDSAGPGRLFRDSSDILAARYKSPERIQNKWGFISASGVDMYSLGVVLHECFNKPGSEPTSGPGEIPQQLHKAFNGMTEHSPSERPDAKTLYASPGFKQMFRNELFPTLLFFDEFQLKTDTERVPFIQALTKSIDGFPRNTCLYKILPALDAGIKFFNPTNPQSTASQSASAMVSLMLQPFIKIGAMIESEEEFQRMVTPTVVDLFGRNDRAIRVALLQKLTDFAQHLDEKLINAKVFPSICSGFDDTAPILRELTVKSAVILAPKLDAKNLNEVLLRHLLKVLKDVEPAIRTNTLICLGKVLTSFNEDTRKKVVTGPFLQGIRDPFVPARVASLRGLSAGILSVESDSQILAGKLIPGLSFALVDPATEVRTAAFTIFDQVLDKLRRASEERTIAQKKEDEERKKKELERVQAGELKHSSSSGETSSATPSSSVVSGIGANSLGDATSYFSAAAGWAVGSLSKTWTKETQNQTTTAGKPEMTSSSAPVTSMAAAPSIFPPAGKQNEGSSGWGEDVDSDIDLGDENSGWGVEPSNKNEDSWNIGEEDGGWGETKPTSTSLSRKPSSGHVGVPKATVEDDFFNDFMTDSKPAKSVSAKKLGLGVAKSAKPSSSSTPDERRAAAEKKREEARQRLAQRREAKPTVVKKSSANKDGDGWDNW